MMEPGEKYPKLLEIAAQLMNMILWDVSTSSKNGKMSPNIPQPLKKNIGNLKKGLILLMSNQIDVLIEIFSILKPI